MFDLRLFAHRVLVLKVGGADNIRKEAEDLPNLENFVQLRLFYCM